MKRIEIRDTPREILLDGIKIKRNGCINTSYQVAIKNPNIQIIEGVIVIYDKNNLGKALAHMWNRYEGIDFDVTAEKIWKAATENEEILRIEYFELQINEMFISGDGKEIDFNETTKINVEEANKIIQNNKTE